MGEEHSPAQREENHYALLVIDMQEHFRAMAEPIVSDLNETIKHCKKKNVGGYILVQG